MHLRETDEFDCDERCPMSILFDVHPVTKSVG